eukprot:616261-Alexandrium_andersonii.AAC.1
MGGEPTPSLAWRGCCPRLTKGPNCPLESQKPTERWRPTSFSTQPWGRRAKRSAPKAGPCGWGSPT